jgi:hypothetical protein
VVPEKADVQHLSQRLESLEKQIVAEHHRLPASPLRRSVEDCGSLTNTVPSDGSPDNALFKESGRECESYGLPSTDTSNKLIITAWIYRMATDARRGFLDANPASPAHTDNAMSALDEALDDLGKLKVRVVEGRSNTTSLEISSAESRECIDEFLILFHAMFMIDIFGKNGFPEVNTLYAFPDLVSSPYVTLDPGLHVLYYNAVFYGLHQLHGSSDSRTRAAYRLHHRSRI